MNNDHLGADFSHIWDFLNDSSNVDGHNIATDDLQPQSSSSCSSSGSSSVPNNSNYSYNFINSTLTDSTQHKDNSMTKNTRLVAADTGGSGRGPGPDFNSMLYTNSNTTPSQHDPLSFLNFTENSQKQQNFQLTQNSTLQDTDNIIDDFLIDFRQPVDSNHTDSQFTNICNVNQSQILTPPGSASSAASHIHEPTTLIDQFKYQNNLTPLTISDQMKLINSPTKASKPQSLSPKKTSKNKTQKVKVEQLLSPPNNEQIKLDQTQLKATSQSSFLTPSPSSCSSSSPAASSHISPVQAVNILAPPPPRLQQKSYVLADNQSIENGSQDNLMLFISENNDSNSVSHSAMHSSSSSASNVDSIAGKF